MSDFLLSRDERRVIRDEIVDCLPAGTVGLTRAIRGAEYGTACEALSLVRRTLELLAAIGVTAAQDAGDEDVEIVDPALQILLAAIVASVADRPGPDVDELADPDAHRVWCELEDRLIGEPA